jgi:hypothetical protein
VGFAANYFGTGFDNSRYREIHLEDIMKSKFFKLSLILFAVVTMAAACARVKFEKEKTPEPPGCVANAEQGCDFEYDIYVGGGVVDILFVDDNSGSMSPDQKTMGQKFPFLMQKLDERMLDYRIGITTTDISSADNPPRPINKNGVLQDGKLIEFESGRKYLEPNVADKNNLFLNTIQRPETIECDNFLKAALLAQVDRNSTAYQKDYYDKCPSGDERAVAAAYKLINNNNDSFIRKEAHLAIVIISDEDNRSWAITDGFSKYSLAPSDQGQNLINLVKTKYGELKSLAVHSVVVQSGDVACLNQQNSQLGGIIKSNYGVNYEQLSDLTQGVKGCVCADDYGGQMGRIGAAIVKQVESFELHCANPVDLKVTFFPESPGNSYTIEGKRLRFANVLASESRVHFKYGCP